MSWHVTIETFISKEWPGSDETDRLRIEDEIRIERRGPKRDFVVAEAHIDGQSPDEAARWAYWWLRTSKIISDQPGGLLNVEVIDEHGQLHRPSMDAIVYPQSDKFFSATAMAGRLHHLRYR